MTTNFERGPIAISRVYDEFKRVWRFQMSDGTYKEVSKEMIEDHRDVGAFAEKIGRGHKR